MNHYAAIYREDDGSERQVAIVDSETAQLMTAVSAAPDRLRFVQLVVEDGWEVGA